MALLSALATEIAILVCAIVGIVFSLVQWLLVRSVKFTQEPCTQSSSPEDSEDSDDGSIEYLLPQEVRVSDQNLMDKCDTTQRDISEGATSFLFRKYQYIVVFLVAFTILIFLSLGSTESFSTQSHPCTYDPSSMCKPALVTAAFSNVSFLLGAFTSVLSGFLGMNFATYANARTTLEKREGVGKAFIAAFRSGAVLGFLLAANGLFVLYIAINLFELYYGNDWEGLFEAITGYGLGGSSMALFERVGGRIYTRAIDVQAKMAGNVATDIPTDRRNLAVIGDNAGEIAGMGSDLFGSYAESSCVALVVASISSFGIDHDFTAICYPLLISSMGILVCLITTLFATDFFEIKEEGEIEPALKKQLIISTILMTVGIAIVSWIALPSSFTIYNFGSQKVVKNWQLFLCAGVGLWAWQIIGSVQDVADPCRTGAATNSSFGLALGFKSVIIQIFAIAIIIFVSFSFAATYGIAVAALGMLSTMATGFTMDAYGLIIDNAEGTAEIAGVSRTSERTDALGAAGNTSAAIRKGFAIGSGALVSLALFGAFVSRAAISIADVLTLKVFIGLIGGAMLPFCLSAVTMKSVGSAASNTAQEEFREIDFATSIKIATDTSMREMIPRGALVMLTPLVVGTFFGVEMLSGVLAGSIVFTQIAILGSYYRAARDNAKRGTEASALEHARTPGPEGSNLLKAAFIRCAIGDLVKNTSGPSLNILIKLMVVESLVFAPFFAAHGSLISKIF